MTIPIFAMCVIPIVDSPYNLEQGGQEEGTKEEGSNSIRKPIDYMFIYNIENINEKYK